MYDNQERVLDEEQWKIEAEAIISDIKEHVGNMEVSRKLQSTNRLVYMNLTTLEGLKFCVELSNAGFSIVGNRHDDTSNKGDEHYETPYSLLNVVSPQYRNSFGNSLLDKLNKLSEEQAKRK